MTLKPLAALGIIATLLSSCGEQVRGGRQCLPSLETSTKATTVSTGSGQELISYDGTNLALDHGVVVVTLNHRLNVLGSFYMGDYEDYFHTELIPTVEAAYKCNGKRAIAGLSMGGYGTLYHALKYPEKFTIEVGLQDATVDNSKAKSLYNSMTLKGLTCEYIEHAGTHDWVFWKECLPKALVAAGNSF